MGFRLFRRSRTARRVFVVVGLAALLGSCAFGVSTPATSVTETGATLTGSVHNTIAGPTAYWFEYGLTTDYGASTPQKSVDVADTTTGYPVNEPITDLLRGREYHSRLCALDAGTHGVCSYDQPFSTVGKSVTGGGVTWVDPSPQIGYTISAFVDASSEPDGSDATGTATISPGSFYFRLPDVGPVTCLRIEATIGFIGYPPGGDGTVSAPQLIRHPGRVGSGGSERSRDDVPVAARLRLPPVRGRRVSADPPRAAVRSIRHPPRLVPVAQGW